MRLFQAIRNVFVSPGFERHYCDKIIRLAAFALETASLHYIQCCSIFGHRWLGDIVINDALLVCFGSIQGFTWMNLGSSFLSNDEN